MYAYIKHASGELEFVEIIAITPTPGVPPRPTPGPTPPDLGIWGPGDPRPTLPIAGWDPGTGTWPKPPRPPGDGRPEGAQIALVVPLPPGTAQPEPPDGTVPGSTLQVVWYGPGTLPTTAWIGPYADAGPPKPQ
jgi:hypothetical protein